MNAIPTVTKNLLIINVLVFLATIVAQSYHLHGKHVKEKMCETSMHEHVCDKLRYVKVIGKKEMKSCRLNQHAGNLHTHSGCKDRNESGND